MKAGDEKKYNRRWFAVTVAAIFLGAAVSFFLTGEGPPPPDEPLVETGPEAPETAAPPIEAAAPAPAPPADEEPTPILARKTHIPAPPPPPRADLPFMRTEPGMEPRIEGDEKTRMAEMNRRLGEWVQLMRDTRPDIRRQLLVAKQQEHERMQTRLADIQEALSMTPDDDLEEQLRNLRDDLYYLEQQIQALETVEEDEP